jgi:hypothetical protein
LLGLTAPAPASGSVSAAPRTKPALKKATAAKKAAATRKAPAKQSRARAAAG